MLKSKLQLPQLAALQAVPEQFSHPPKGGVSLEQSRRIIESRVMPQKVFDPKAKAKSLSATNTVLSPASIVELARALKNDPDLMYEHVYNNVEFHSTYGSQKGAVGALLDCSGNAFDQADILLQLFTEAGLDADIVLGDLRLTETEATTWLGTTDLSASRNLLLNGGIPATITWTGSANVLDFSHAWVRVDIGGTYYHFDSAIKTYDTVSSINLETALDYDAGNFLDDATDGATIDPDYIQDMNRTNVRNNLTTLATNLKDWIKTNAHGAKLDEIIGGRRIVAQSGQVRDTAHPKLKPGSSPSTYSTMPNAYKCTLQVRAIYASGSYSIDETFYSADLYGKKLHILLSALFLDDDLIATGAGQLSGSWNSLDLHAVHPYSSTWADQYSVHRIWYGHYYVVGNLWGGGPGRGMIEHYRNKMDSSYGQFFSVNSTDTLAMLWYENAHNGELINRMINQFTGCVSVMHHALGVSGHFNTPILDIGGVKISTSALDDDSDKVNVNDTVLGMHGIASEAATIGQTCGVGGVSTSILVDVAINDGQKIYDATDANWDTDVEPNLTNYSSQDKTDIENFYINSDLRVVLPEDGAITKNSFVGMGYFVLPDSGAFGIINGGLKGGAGDESILLYLIGEVMRLVDWSRAYRWRREHNYSIDPIGMSSGNLAYEHTDLTFGCSPEPYGLSFTRSYNSARKQELGPMGRGWSHNFDMTVRESASGSSVLGEAVPIAAVAAIAEIFVCVDLLSDLSKPLDKFLTACLGNVWLVDQTLNNQVVVDLGNDTHMFVKTPDGEFVSTSGSASVLTKNMDDTYTVTTPQQAKYNFNEESKIDTIEHPFGMTTSFTYEDGLLTAVSTALGRTLEFGYDVENTGWLQTITDGNRTVTLNYDVEDTGYRLLSVTDPDSQDIVYEYDESFQLTKIFMPEHPEDEFVTNVYDSLGRVMEQTDSENNTWEYFFAGARSEEVDPESNRKIFYYDGSGNPIRQIDALGNVTATEFDGLNRVTKETLPEGNSTEYQYDANNNVLQISHHPKPGSGLSDITQIFTYDPDWNRVATAQDGRGNVTTYSYDAMTGQLLSIEQPEVDSEVPETVFTYDGNGRLETRTDPTGIVTRWNWSDTDETLESVVHDEGMGRLNLTTAFGYDDAGNIDSITDARTNETTRSFTALRQLESVTSPSPFTSLVTELQYDANGNRTLMRRSTGDVMNPWQTYETGYSKSNDVESQTDPMSHVTSFGFDALRRVNSIEDPEERVTEMDYNERGQIETVEDAADNTVATNSYTDNGFIESLTDARTNATSYEYDGFDRLKKITYADTTFEEFDWDENGNLLNFTNRNGDEIAFEYDELNRLRVKTPDNLPEVSFEYDLAGRLESVSTTPVMGHPGSGEFQYGYDTAGRLTSEEMPDSKTVSYDLDEVGNVTKVTFPDSYYVEREFDELNRLQSITLNGAMTAAVEFEYDDLSRRKKITFGNGVETDFTYRDDNQVESISHTFDGSSVLFEYTYNDAGELIGQEVDDADFMWHPAGSGTTSYGTASDINTYPTVGGDTYSYNNNGCLEDDDTWAFVYDTENRMTSADDGGTTVDFLYDPQNRQVQKAIGASKTRFLYAGIQRIADYDENGDLVNRFVYGTGLDDVLLQIAPNGDVTYLHADRLGSVVGTSNAGGVNTAKFGYGPFGETDNLSGVTHGYAGQRFDSQTGLYYMKNRYYFPTIGRFMQPDPIGTAGSQNIYNYVSNAPFDFRDTLGLFAESVKDVWQKNYTELLDIFTQLDPRLAEVDPEIAAGSAAALAALLKKYAFKNDGLPGDYSLVVDANKAINKRGKDAENAINAIKRLRGGDPLTQVRVVDPESGRAAYIDSLDPFKPGHNTTEGLEIKSGQAELSTNQKTVYKAVHDGTAVFPDTPANVPKLKQGNITPNVSLADQGKAILMKIAQVFAKKL